MIDFKTPFNMLAVCGIIAFSANAVFGQNHSPWMPFQDENPLYLVNIGDADLAVRHRKGVGTPVVLVHGSWDDHHAWMPVVERLAGAIKNPLVLYDRRGHGASSPDKEQGSIGQDVDDLLRLVEKLGFEKAHFIGHSYGASTVVQLAAARPERAESIVLYEPPMFGLLKNKPEHQTEMQAVKQAMATAKTLLENGEIEKGTIHFAEKAAFGENSWQSLFDARSRSTMAANYRTWLDQTNDPERLNIRPEKLNGFKGKITAVSGARSIPVYPAVVRELKAKVGKITVKTLPEAGHGGIVSHPAETAGIILGHLF